MARDWASFDHWGTGNVDELRAYIGHLHRGRDALRGENTALRAALEPLVALPYVIDEATVPKAGIDAAPEQVIGTLHVSLAKMRKLRAALDGEVSDEPCPVCGKSDRVAEPDKNAWYSNYCHRCDHSWRPLYELDRSEESG